MIAFKYHLHNTIEYQDILCRNRYKFLAAICVRFRNNEDTESISPVRSF